MVGIQSVYFVVTAMSVAFGAVIGVIQFRNLVKTRRVQFYLEVYSRFCEKEMLRD